jgi:hypothetical protein
MTSLITEAGSTVEVTATDVKGEVVITLDDAQHAFTSTELSLLRTLINFAEQEASPGGRNTCYQF